MRASDPTQQRRALGTADTPAVLARFGVAGTVAGVFATVAESSSLSARWVSDLATYPALWVVVLALLGVTAPTVRTGALRGVTFFVALCLVYFGWSIVGFGLGASILLVPWLGIAVTVVPTAAAAAWWARRNPGVASAAVTAVAIAMVTSDGVFLRTYLRMSGIEFMGPGEWAQVVVDVLAIGALLIVVPGGPGTRAMAAISIVPAVWIGQWVGWWFLLLQVVLVGPFV